MTIELIRRKLNALELTYGERDFTNEEMEELIERLIYNYPEDKDPVVEIKPYHALPCELEVFTINGKEADEEDFGNKSIGGDCMECTCGCIFKKHAQPKQEVLKKYGITPKMYDKICEQLEEELQVSFCGWCS